MSAPDPIRLGVLGVAGIGQAHLFAGSMLPEYELVAACDLAAAPLGKAAADFGVTPFDEPAALFGSSAVDAVVIATPPATHAALVEDALDAGLHVYCEKPLVPTAAASGALDRLARSAGRGRPGGSAVPLPTLGPGCGYLVEAGEIGEFFRADLAATELVPIPALLHQRSVARHLAGVGRRRADEPGDPPDRHARVDRRPALDRHGLGATLAAPGRGRGRRARVPRVRQRRTGHAGGIHDRSRGRRRGDGARRLGTLSIEGFRLRRATFGDGKRGAQQLTDESTEDFDDIPVEWVDVVAPGGKSEWFDMMLDCHRDFAASISEGRSTAIPPAEASLALGLVERALPVGRAAGRRSRYRSIRRSTTPCSPSCATGRGSCRTDDATPMTRLR